MVSKKRQNYCGFDGFHSPVVPKAPRSIRRNPHKKSSTGNEICAFELLAAVAGKLLQESEGSASSNTPDQKDQINIPKDNVKQEPLEEVKLKPDLDHGCCAESQFIPEIPSNNLELKLEPPLKDSILSDNDSGLEHASIVTTQDFFTNVKLEGSDSKNIAVNTPSKSEGDFMDSNIPKIIEKESDKKSYSSVHEDLLHLPFYSDSVPLRRRGRNVKKIGNVRDDDENYSFSCTTKLKAFRLQSRGGYGYRRMRKMFSSKYWKTVPKLKDYEVSNTKKRKLFQHTSKPEYVDETSSESISNLPDRHPSKRVKFSIKSFKVPELYLEMPETSTVGSLKRTVMEALTAILGSELHVGVLFEGKKVRDDNITLQQTGISLNSDTLGFMLEPTLPEPSESPVQKQAPMSPQSDNHQPLPTDSPITDPGFSISSVGVNPMPETNQIEKTEEEEIAVDTNTITNTNTNTNSNTKAIVPITEAVPLNQKLTKRSELSQRRTRRPFSVSEVEALVEAVETLGTGRWRDVKIRAFDDANHRTYVDLKDKWKTLVHTASISPQQRRGEPVPQNLLDRVLGAHGFWSTHQSKQLVKVETPVKVCLDLEG